MIKNADFPANNYPIHINLHISPPLFALNSLRIFITIFWDYSLMQTVTTFQVLVGLRPINGVIISLKAYHWTKCKMQTLVSTLQLINITCRNNTKEKRAQKQRKRMMKRYGYINVSKTKEGHTMSGGMISLGLQSSETKTQINDGIILLSLVINWLKRRRVEKKAWCVWIHWSIAQIEQLKKVCRLIFFADLLSVEVPIYRMSGPKTMEHVKRKRNG